MDLNELALEIWARLDELAITPVAEFYGGLDPGDRAVFYALLATAAVAGLILGWGRPIRRGVVRFRKTQNAGEAMVSRVLTAHLGPPDHHLMNHITLRMGDGTTQIDHILASRFGIFVIETKPYQGWVFGSAAGSRWTQVLFRSRFSFQNPILQNKRHVRAVQDLLDFLPVGTVKPVVVFSGDAEFKTEVPDGVVMLNELTEYIQREAEELLSMNQLQLCVGRLETARLAISGKTDVEHVRSLARRHSGLGAR